MRAPFFLRKIAEELAAQTPDLTQTATKIADHILSGKLPVRKTGNGENFWQYREYQTGDMPSRIDWRQSSKSDTVFIREKQLTKTQHYALWIKRNSDMKFSSLRRGYSKQQTGIIISLVLAILHSRSGDIFSYLGETRAGQSEISLQNLQSALLKTDIENFPTASIKIPKNCHLYLVSDFLETIEEIKAMLNTILGFSSNITIIQTLDPAEINLPYTGRIVFQNPNQTLKVTIDNTENVSRDYNKRILNHCKALQNLCAENRIEYHMHATNQALNRLIFELWNNRRLKAAS